MNADTSHYDMVILVFAGLLLSAFVLTTVMTI
jgi:hypothetical protein